MVPLLEEFNQQLGDKAEVVKFNCNKDNKELGKSLGIKVAPTFHLYRGEKQVGSWSLLLVASLGQAQTRCTLC